MQPMITLVTFPVDYGSVTLQNNFLAMLKGRAQVKHHVFSPREAPGQGPALSRLRRILYRLQQMPELRRVCHTARTEQRTLLFQQISPALFALPFLRGARAYIVADWNRKLYEPITGARISPTWLTRLHAWLFTSVTGIITYTAAAQRSFINDYGVPPERVHRIKMPFDVCGTVPAPHRANSPLRILFVGGDFYRKGGDALVRWFRAHQGPAVELTIMTQSQVELPPGIRLVRNDPSLSAKDLLQEYDLFVLPTRYDAFPLAIGEAASAGLAVVTTINALGASEVIEPGLNGEIVRDEEDLFFRLDELAADRQRVERYKAHSRMKMQAQFAYAHVFAELRTIICSTSSCGMEADPLAER
ncbi:glycosyltransferase family 4 protein [Pseudomonas sp.]|uniref:glycosyltransferase family 4 protein n=1 Tax=Pseudomonas sp. TaxID=306 RepID=UPI00272A9F35|nr:glycosyltransferase family 4 protein [Pseudomonas sp.]